MTSSCSATRPISRYFKTGGTLARLGIDWCDTREITDFGINPPTQLYGEQLPIDAGSSTNIKVYRPATNTIGAAQLGRLQLTYYVLYKGAKG
jgi:hypothetical protein